jgi:hypothetical protein
MHVLIICQKRFVQASRAIAFSCLFCSPVLVMAHESGGGAASTAGETKNPGESRGKDKVDPPSLLFEAITIPIIKGDKLVAYLRLNVVVDTKKMEAFEEVDKKKMRLRDAFFNDLYDSLGRLWSGPDDPKIDSIRTRLTNVCKRKFPEIPMDVYIKGFYMDKRQSAPPVVEAADSQ